MRILLVDDSTTMRRIQKNQLNALGINDIIEASNGKEAIDILAANMPIDIVVLDWNMPEMTGIELLKYIRSIDTYSKVKVIMCTSEAEKEKVIEALKLGANNYIVKPFTPEILKEKLGI